MMCKKAHSGRMKESETALECGVLFWASKNPQVLAVKELLAIVFEFFTPWAMECRLPCPYVQSMCSPAAHGC
jgi:hypothetical protein